MFYARTYSVPWLGGEGDGALTHFYLWKSFAPAWPTNGPESIGGMFETIPAWGVPFINTLIQFLIIAMVIFLLVKAINSLRRKEAEKPAPAAPAGPTPSEALLTEIRDLLQAQAPAPPPPPKPVGRTTVRRG